MSSARRRTWMVAATLAVAGTTFAGAAVGADGGTPVEAAGSASDATAGHPTTTGDRATTTSAEPTTTTTVAPTTTDAPTTTAAPTSTTTAAPTTTAPPPPPPTTTAPPPPAPPAPAPANASGPAPSATVHGARNTGCEQYMHDRINGARAGAGRSPLGFDTGIQYIAVRWSDHLAGTQNLAHNPDYGNQIVAHRDYRKAGENVGRGFDLGELFQAFMDSPGHRENILSAGYSHVTVGCLTDAAGQLWVTQNFWG